MFASIETGLGYARADCWQVFRIPFKRTASANQLLPKTACPDRFQRYFVAKPDLLVATRKEPEVIALTAVLLSIHLGEVRSLCLQGVVDIGRSRFISNYDVLVVLVFHHDDYDVVVHRETRRPWDACRSVRR